MAAPQRSTSTNPWFRMNAMHRAIGVVLILVGGVWFFQGIGVAEGSDMSNNPWWAALGAAFFVAGFIVLYRANVAAKRTIAAEQEAASAADAGSGVAPADDSVERDDGDDRPDAVQRHE